MLNTEEEKKKALSSIVQSKGQLEASINKVEDHLNREEFEDYCDNMAICTAYMNKIANRIKNPESTRDVRPFGVEGDFEDRNNKSFKDGEEPF